MKFCKACNKRKKILFKRFEFEDDVPYKHAKLQSGFNKIKYCPKCLMNKNRSLKRVVKYETKESISEILKMFKK